MKKRSLINLISLISLIMIAFATLIGCKDTNAVKPLPDNDSQVIPSKYIISNTEISLYSGETKHLTVSGGDGAVTWKSSENNIATVDEGMVTAINEGVCYITAIVESQELSCKVNVTEKMVPVSELYLDKQSSTFGKGQNITITPYIINGEDEIVLDSNKVSWESSDSNVVSVKDGVLKGVEIGTATITATYNYEGKELTAKFDAKVISLNYYRAYDENDREISSVNPISVAVANAYFNSTVQTEATVRIKEYDVLTDEELGEINLDNVTWKSIDNDVATGNGPKVKGGTKVGNTELEASIDGDILTRIHVEGITQIDTKEQMDKLSLVTWTERNDKLKVQEILSGKYVLGSDIDYKGEYLLPIANHEHQLKDDSVAELDMDWGCVSYCSWVWKDILFKLEPNAPELANWGERNCTFKGTNPLKISFNGTFDGNGHSIKNAQFVDVNFLYSNRTTNNRTSAAGGCFIGEIGKNGELKNINFEDLRFRKFYGETSAERETNLDIEKYPQTNLYFGSVGKKLPYNDGLYRYSQSALVMFNRGKMNDIRVSSHFVPPATAVYTNNNLNENNKNNAFATVLNYDTGLINNFVAELLSGPLTYLRHSDAYVNGKDGELVKGYVDIESGITKSCWAKQPIFYGRNYGKVQNSIFLSQVKEGEKVQVFADSKDKKENLKSMWDCYSENNAGANAGTISNCNGYIASATERALDLFNKDTTIKKDSFNNGLWDITTMRLKLK